jgi:hypothetical protein
LVECEPAFLERLLRAMFDTRKPVEGFNAMQFNHHIGMAHEIEFDYSRPFWEERLWDFYDDENEEAQREGQRKPYWMTPGARPRPSSTNRLLASLSARCEP